jgi:formate hydrogenlyase subunit 3/multisubunit Na+/H+ antiporter MnhD subunit
MDLLVAGILALLGSGFVALLLGLVRLDRAAIAAATAGVVAGALLAGWPALLVLTGATPPLAERWPWGLPLASIALHLDRLASFFLLTVLGVSAAAAVYGSGYLEHYRGKKQLGPQLFLYNLLVVAMAVVVLARNGVLFLFGWETMAVAAAFLVAFEDEHEEVRRAVLTYLVLTHISSALVTAFFLILGREAGTLDYESLVAHAPVAGPLGHVLFALALLGFGIKAGIWPLHIWLPQAHPAAPTHVSAVMSGLIVKTAIYALIRGLWLLGEPRPAWGLIVLALGVVSGVLGVLYALAQHDLKRLLAYHTIENVGIILLGIGTGLLGVAWRSPSVAVLGFAGGILHVLNHALFKSLLFFGAGAVLQATGTRDIEKLGGLAKKMPWTAVTFVVAAAAISGLPPLNGFVSEFLVYAGLFRGALDLGRWTAFALVAAITSLALIGGLAAACFAKASGAVFLGTARTEAAASAHECGLRMRAPMVAIAIACAAIGLWPALAVQIVAPVAADLARVEAAAPAAATVDLLSHTSIATTVLVAVAIGLALLRRAVLAGRPVEAGATWGCGYGSPTPRMQYTASSFAAPLVALASSVLRTTVHDEPPQGYFPEIGRAERSTHQDDLADERALRPAARAVARALVSVRWLQQGRLQLYLLYILIALVALLAWQLLGATP